MHPATFQRALRAHLERAQAAFGSDLPLAVPDQSPFPAPPSRQPSDLLAGAAPPENPGAGGSARSAAGPAAQGSAPQTRAAAERPTGKQAPSPAAAAQPVAHASTPPKPRPDAAAALADIAARAGSCTACPLAKTRTQVVPGEGPATAEVFFVGEAPGATEDRTGRPFVGKAGQLLDKIIENAMGMTREEVFIGNVNKCRPPENRDPMPEEVAACLPYLRAQVAAVQPRVLVTLGRVAAWNLLGDHRPMRALRGLDLSYEGIPVVATWHPAYLLRNPAAKRDTWLDIQRVNQLLGRPAVPPAAQ